ncbi:MAG: hypothetical protein ABIA63_01605 [bacterium]
MFKLCLLAWGICLIIPCWTSAQIKRSRGEDLPTIVSSNTIGFGNIWGQIYGTIREDRGILRIEPLILGEIGLAGNMAFQVGMIPFEQGFIGKTEAHLKFTLPNNDNLRSFGLALIGDLILTTEEDTLSLSQDSSRPAFNPWLGGTIAMDYDFFRDKPDLPLKLFFNCTNIDYDRFMPAFDQLSFKAAAEYRFELFSIFMTSRLALYKEKETNLTPKVNGSYDQQAGIIGAGFRYRKTSFWILPTRSFSFSMLFEKTLFSNWYSKDFPYPGFFAAFRMEWSPFYRETKSEALRNMMLMEKRRKAELAVQEKTFQQKRSESPSANSEGPYKPIDTEEFEKLLGVEDELLKKQNEIVERRKRIQYELDKIEELIE